MSMSSDVTNEDGEAAWCEGFDAAVAVFESGFFSGPTREMVMGWFRDARAAQHPGGE